MDRRVDEEVRARLVSIRGWRGLNNPWMHEDEADADFSYINLVANPERYTGYKARARPAGAVVSAQSCNCCPCGDAMSAPLVLEARVQCLLRLIVGSVQNLRLQAGLYVIRGSSPEACSGRCCHLRSSGKRLRVWMDSW